MKRESASATTASPGQNSPPREVEARGLTGVVRPRGRRGSSGTDRGGESTTPTRADVRVAEPETAGRRTPSDSPSQPPHWLRPQKRLMFHVKRRVFAHARVRSLRSREHVMFHVKRRGDWRRWPDARYATFRERRGATASHGVFPRAWERGDVTGDLRSDASRGPNARRTATGDPKSGLDTLVPRYSTGGIRRSHRCAAAVPFSRRGGCPNVCRTPVVRFPQGRAPEPRTRGYLTTAEGRGTKRSPDSQRIRREPDRPDGKTRRCGMRAR